MGLPERSPSRVIRALDFRENAVKVKDGIGGVFPEVRIDIIEKEGGAEASSTLLPEQVVLRVTVPDTSEVNMVEFFRLWYKIVCKKP